MALIDDLVSYWTLDEASGTRADSHGSNDLADTNTVTQAAGIISTAAQFTSANQERLVLSDTAIFDALSAATFAGWLYADSLAADITFASKYASSTAGFELTWSPTFGFAAYWMNAGFQNGSTGTGGYSATTWYHIACVFDGAGGDNAARCKIYIDGVSQTLNFSGTIPASYATNAAVFKIGMAAVSRYWNGRIDEAGFWSRPLTSDEVTELYNGGAGLAYPFSSGGGFQPAWSIGSNVLLGLN
jgi:hypothetical protein